jgi:hypothetical protein
METNADAHSTTVTAAAAIARRSAPACTFAMPRKVTGGTDNRPAPVTVAA